MRNLSQYSIAGVVMFSHPLSLPDQECLAYVKVTLNNICNPAQVDAYMGSTDLTNSMNLQCQHDPLSGHEGKVPTICCVPEYVGGRLKQRHQFQSLQRDFVLKTPCNTRRKYQYRILSMILGRFKPSPAAYYHLTERTENPMHGKTHGWLVEMLLISRSPEPRHKRHLCRPEELR